jgi:hypothetical protein
MRRPAVFLLVALVVAPAWSGISSAYASFDSTAGATESVSSAGLSPPTSLSATGTNQVVLTWVTTTSTIASGTLVFRSTAPGGPYTQIGQIPGLTTSGYTDSPGSGTFYYVVSSYESALGASWTSGASNQVGITLTVAPSFVKNIANSSCQTAVSVLAVPTGGVAAGDTVIVSVAVRGLIVAGPVAVTDAGLNGYRVDADVTNGAGVRTIVLSSHLTTTLAASAAITVVTPAADWAMVSVAEFSHLSPAAADGASTTTGSGDTASATVAATTGGDLLFAAIGEGNNQGLQYTEPTGWATGYNKEANCGGLTAKLALHTASLVAGAAGNLSYTPSTTNGRDWAEAIVAYKAG